ncbi:MAG TPA: 4-hydroxy-tetrahydrodipicolinate reductase [Methylomirabilota bacterium]|nr:4-hydroxy-tetrahydrodipicolinate reductase [Methylomirabilota bacterium]
MAEVVVAGAAGRMGSRLVALLKEDAELRLVGALEAPGHPSLGRDAGESAGVGRLTVPITADAEAVLGKDRILIEFSVPEASLAHVRIVARQGGRAVIGTTGFSAPQREELEKLAREAPILVSPNMSVAVNVAFRILADMARMLGDDYDVEIVETHHRFKKDAPSGTAMRMAEVVARALGRDLAQTAVYDRHGKVAERSRKDIGIAALRSGDVVGEHTVSFGSLGERLELTHRAHSRDNFARGALRAARFIATARPGLYSMQDVLGLA